jgi:hypothetical protein
MKNFKIYMIATSSFLMSPLTSCHNIKVRAQEVVEANEKFAHGQARKKRQVGAVYGQVCATFLAQGRSTNRKQRVSIV